jgi:hypothetical protein
MLSEWSSQAINQSGFLSGSGTGAENIAIYFLFEINFRVTLHYIKPFQFAGMQARQGFKDF